jgi:hypothetical protein
MYNQQKPHLSPAMERFSTPPVQLVLQKSTAVTIFLGTAKPEGPGIREQKKDTRSRPEGLFVIVSIFPIFSPRKGYLNMYVEQKKVG